MLDTVAGFLSSNEPSTTGDGSATPTKDDDTFGSTAVADATNGESAAAGTERDELSDDSPASGTAVDDDNASIVDDAGVSVKHPETDTAATAVADTEPVEAADASGTASAVSGQLADGAVLQATSLQSTGQEMASTQQAGDTVATETDAEKIVTERDRVEAFQASTHSPQPIKNRPAWSAGSPAPPSSSATTLRSSSTPATTEVRTL